MVCVGGKGEQQKSVAAHLIPIDEPVIARHGGHLEESRRAVVCTSDLYLSPRVHNVSAPTRIL